MSKFSAKSYTFPDIRKNSSSALRRSGYVAKWQQSGSRAQRYEPLFITIRLSENIKISKLLISFTSNWDS